MAIIIDNMEYATDVAAQAAYVSSNPSVIYGNDLCVGGTPTAKTIYSGTFDAAKAVDNNEATLWNDNVSGMPQWWQYDFGVGNEKIINRLRVKPGYEGVSQRFKDFYFEASNGVGWTLLYTGQHANTYLWEDYDFVNTTAYRYYRINITSIWGSPITAGIHELEMKLRIAAIQCYSESFIITEGAYSLKVVANSTAVNETLTKTLITPLNLSNQTTITLKVRASRSGTNLQLRLHDSGGTTSTKNITIAVADTWETIMWDISTISNNDKDAIDQIIFRITNADVLTTYYIDNMLAKIAQEVPDPSDVRDGVEYGEFGLLTGTLDLPEIEDVRDGTIFDNAMKEGILDLPNINDIRKNISFDQLTKTGTCYVPVKANVRDGINVDVSDVGELDIPLEIDVRLGIKFDNETKEGTLDLPSINDVEKGVVFDNTTKIGTLKVPLTNDVRDGVQYGANDVEKEGILDLPSEADVKKDVVYDNGTKTGTFEGGGDVPEEKDVREGVQYDNLTKEGILHLPTEAQVSKDVKYGANEEFSGTLETTQLIELPITLEIDYYNEIQKTTPNEIEVLVDAQKDLTLYLSEEP